MNEKEKVIQIQNLSEEVIQMIVKDGYEAESQSLKRAVELLSQVIYDLTIINSNENCNQEETLKGTLAKMKIAHNAISTGIKKRDDQKIVNTN